MMHPDEQLHIAKPFRRVQGLKFFADAKAGRMPTSRAPLVATSRYLMFKAEVCHGFQQVETVQTTLQQFLLVLVMINKPFTLAKVLVGMRVVVLVREGRIHVHTYSDPKAKAAKYISP